PKCWRLPSGRARPSRARSTPGPGARSGVETMPFLFYDPTFILLIPAMLLAMWAQWRVQHAYNEMSRVRASNGLTGRDMAQAILTRNGITDVQIEEVGGTLSDHFDPRTRKVRLSTGVYRGDSLASIAVAAHETGHVLQH